MIARNIKRQVTFSPKMSELAHLGLTAVCIGKLNGVTTWKISGNTRPYAGIFKQYNGYWSTGCWRLTDTNYSHAVKAIIASQDINPAKKRKTDKTLELDKKRDEWQNIMTSIDAHGYRFIIDEVFLRILKEKGESAWGSIMSADEAIHSCGCNIVWELFLAAQKDIDSVAGKFSSHCNACGESFLQ